MLGVRASFFLIFFFCGVVVICFILQRVAPVTMEMDSRSIVSEDITGALFFYVRKGEFILAKHREKEKEKCFCMCARVCLFWDCFTNGYLLLVTSGDGRKDSSLMTFMTFFLLLLLHFSQFTNSLKDLAIRRMEK